MGQNLTQEQLAELEARRREIEAELRDINAQASAAPSLHQRLVNIMDAIPEVAKDGNNSAQRYDFVSHDQIVRIVSRQLVAQNVAFNAAVIRYEALATGSQDKNGNPTFRTLVFTEYTFTCGDTGESQTHPWMGDALDTQDKGLYKAITQSKKTFLLSTFLIASGEKGNDADEKTPIYKGSRFLDNKRSYDRPKPTATNKSGGRGQNGGRDQYDQRNQTPDPSAGRATDSKAREMAFEKVKELAATPDGKWDWQLIDHCVDMTHGPGPWDKQNRSFKEWNTKELQSLAATLHEETDRGGN